MKSFFEPIVREIGEAIAKEASKASRQSLPDIISISMTIILTLVGVVGCIITLYMYLSESFTDRHAMLIVTMGALFLAILSSLIAKNKLTNEVQVEKEPCEDQSDKNPSPQIELATSLGMEVSKLIGKHPKNASLIAMAIGVSMGVSPELRKAVIEQITPSK